MIRILLTAAAASALMACSSTKAPMSAQAPSPATVLNGVLVGPNQMTLYVFDKDVPGSGRSVCNDACAANWPPLAAPAGAMPIGDWSPIIRDDGSKQWAYKGRPLYNWVKDSRPGDKTGDGFLNNNWHVARP
ncbi:hypothetical protein [Diaphorobacter ruginosibacter]|uniref:COG4315 family predicted lipoprotein n=1 Tax=Diaphorobacter ruginosibacter TaxID=1715720 RepID=UPI003341B5D1